MMSTEGRAYRALAGYRQLVIANLRWLLVSVTVVAAPAATAALFTELHRIRGGAGTLGWQGYLRQVRANFRPSLGIFVVAMIPIGAVTAICVLAMNSGALLVLGMSMVGLVGLVAVAVHLGPAGLALHSLGAVVREAARRAVLFPAQSIGCAALCFFWLGVLVLGPRQLLLLPLSVLASGPTMVLLAVSERLGLTDVSAESAAPRGRVIALPVSS